MEYIDKYDQLLKLLTEEVEIDGKKYLLKEEFDKFFVRGNKAAATRIRKFMQLIKSQSQEVRDDVQEYRKKV
jgi:phage gpG-like protein